MKPSLLLGDNTHQELSDLLKAKHALVISGTSNETAKALLLSHLLSFHPQTTLLLTQNDGGVEALQHWLRFFEQEAVVLHPVRDNEGAIIPAHLQTFLAYMQEGRDDLDGRRVYLCDRATWDGAFPSFAEITKKKVTLKEGEDLPFTQFVEQLIERGYAHGTDLYLSPGEYRRIGDTLDIYPIQSPHPYRISFDFDKVQMILAVDAADLSKTTPAGKKLDIFPATFERTQALTEQLPAQSLLVLDDQDDISIDPRAGMPAPQVLSFTAFPEASANHAHLRYLSVLKFYTLTDFLNDVRDKLTQAWTLLIVTKRVDELAGILKEEHIPVLKEDHRPGAVTLIPATEDDLLPHSLQNPDLKCALLTDREIFTLKKAGKQRGVAKLALDFITSLQAGDYVVHMDHGIGHFEGMTQKAIDDIFREYLEISYAGGDKLFVPVDQADKLSKFVHEEGEEPVLTRLGTVEWKRVTEKMREETKLIAKELLNLYAKRARSRGHSFNEDTEKQRKFDEAFPYEETPGQRAAIADLKKDMESEHPMDRLICGDVGFGKTEVAMRAAFKAVQGGRQVAVIAPITILADQHYRNFQERMKGFGVRVDMLSRFRSAAEQKVTLEKLRKGDVDIIVGTHRLLQDDVKFFNLGLVVIDEEQRFGVKQKEKFKEMRANVDILTLTATPIPRTLNLGLHKLRDITTITTPPPGRLPIITEVRKYSDELVRQAIMAEVKRGGQCFVLHNRVETIDAFADKLRRLIPSATFVVGHGQLPPDKLEERILSFKEGKCDVLVSSTIIENGIDLPRANTLIVNEAERFGLAQLYQLRGRVGRSKLQAFAYFLYHTQKLKDDAKKRLKAIVEACELGSGFQVAMRDLEIRGAGEILGASQSGTMQTVGVSHYLRMLKHAVDELKGGAKEAEEVEVQTEIQVSVEAFIPSFYIPDSQEKISVYQKLAGSEEIAILQEFEADLRDEYGEPPEQVENLFRVLRLKMACREGGVVRVKSDQPSLPSGATAGRRDAEIVLTLSDRVTAKEIMQLLRVNSQWKISGQTLRIAEAILVQRAKGRHWLEELTDEVAMLKREKVKAKEKVKAEEEVEAA
ncbi:MAG: transcription-repair coupling factor [Candidatus Peribacteraceae bacterium]|nr:transcription-repair coupling factor [Candidatus Peribacteraceae bacterium]